MCDHIPKDSYIPDIWAGYFVYFATGQDIEKYFGLFGQQILYKTAFGLGNKKHNCINKNLWDLMTRPCPKFNGECYIAIGKLGHFLLYDIYVYIYLYTYVCIYVL